MTRNATQGVYILTPATAMCILAAGAWNRRFLDPPQCTWEIPRLSSINKMINVKSF